MLDIQFIRDNPELVQEKSRQKGYDVDIARLLELDIERRTRQTQADELRRRRNEQAAALKSGGRPTDEQIAAGKALKEELATLEADLKRIDDDFEPLVRAVPNMPLDDVPVGLSEDENVVSKRVGEPPVFEFTPKHDYELGELGDFIDKERAAKISGSRFAYLKGGIVRLQFAIVQFVMDTLGDDAVLQQLIDENGLNISAKPFTPVLPPAVLRTEPYVASARLNAAEVTYKLENDDLWLNASAEHTLCTMYWNEILPEDMFPIRYIGYSTSFRREAGTYGKDMEGIFRMHQFDKLEMEVFSTAETGLDEHRLQVAIQEYLVQQLGLSYQVLQKCTFDIGKPNASGYDIECWFPAQGRYRETHTADYMTDYQSRDLKVRVRRADGNVELVHTNDATAFALGRILKAIMENYQTAEGDIIIPEVLRPYMGGRGAHLMLRIEISGVHAPVDDRLKRYIRRRIGGLDRFVPRRRRKYAWFEVRLHETGDADRNACTCDVTLHIPDAPIHVSETTVNMFAAVDIAQEQLKHRIRKYKELHQPSKLRHRLMRRRKRDAAVVADMVVEERT